MTTVVDVVVVLFCFTLLLHVIRFIIKVTHTNKTSTTLRKVAGYYDCFLFLSVLVILLLLLPLYVAVDDDSDFDTTAKCPSPRDSS